MEDKCGREIHVGDYIVYGHAIGRSASLKFGKIIKITEKDACGKKVYTYRVAGISEDYSFKTPSISIGTVLYEDRMIILPFDLLPDYAKELLAPIEVV